MAIVLQQAATVMLSDNGAFEMLDYIISLREGIMDAWSGIIIALKQGKGWSTKPQIRLCFLMVSSRDLDPICGVNFQVIASCSPRSQSKRGPFTISYGRYWVRTSPQLKLTTCRTQFGVAIWQIPSPKENMHVIFVRNGSNN